MSQLTSWNEVRENPGTLSLEAIVSLLRLSQWDYEIISGCYDRLVRILPKASEMEREDFCQAIHKVEERHFKFDAEENPDFCFGTLMGAMGRHEEAIVYYCRAKTIYNTATTEHNLGLSYLLSGRLEEALGSFHNALILDRQMTSAKLFYEKINAWLSAEKFPLAADEAVGSKLDCLENQSFIRERLGRPDLRIEPLLPRHAQAMYSYATPEIMSLTGLPTFATLNEAEDWIKAKASEPRNYTFATMHSDFGFVGVVSVTVIGDKAGRIFFWLGGPFMGKGYATTAVCRLLRFAYNTLRLEELFTCALAHNERSARLLQRVGFRRVELPKAELHYYRSGVERLEGRELTERLLRFFGKAESRIFIRQINL